MKLDSILTGVATFAILGTILVIGTACHLPV